VCVTAEDDFDAAGRRPAQASCDRLHDSPPADSPTIKATQSPVARTARLPVGQGQRAIRPQTFKLRPPSITRPGRARFALVLQRATAAGSHRSGVATEPGVRTARLIGPTVQTVADQLLADEPSLLL
jgi:hypothetical protein